MFEDVEKNINHYIIESREARAKLVALNGFEITSTDIQNALCEIFEIAVWDPGTLADKKLSRDDIFNELKNYPFNQVLEEFTLDQACLPDDLPDLYEEQVVKVKGEQWTVHKNDKDPFPSNPHAHNYAKGISLHLGTGEFFKKRKSHGFITCKQLIAIRDKLTIKNLPKLANRCK